jgi:ABC-type nitrate/sulfonate/bicarbonate transport system permease component
MLGVVEGSDVLARPTAHPEQPAVSEPGTPLGAPSRTPLAQRRGAGVVLGALGVLLVFGLAELVSRTGLVSPQDIPPASEVVGELVSQLGSSEFWSQVGNTLLGWAVGLAIATVGGIAFGVLLGSSVYIRTALRPTVEFLRPVPSVALIPLAILVWGQDLGSKVFLVVVGALWPIVIQAMYGVSQVDDVARDTANSYGLDARERLRYLILPSALPFIATGLRIASATALIVGVTAELVIGNEGLGNGIALAQAGGNTELMYALILATGVLGIAIHLLFSALERPLLRWHTSQRSSG